MHREDHGRRAAGHTKHVADVDGIGDSRAIAAQFDGDQHAQQAMLSRCSKGLEGKPRVAVNFGGMLGGSRRYEPCTRGRMRSRRLSPGIGYIESLHAQRPVIEWLLEPLFIGGCQKWATTRAKCRTNRVVIPTRG